MAKGAGMSTENGVSEDRFRAALLGRRELLAEEREAVSAEISTKERRRAELEEQIGHIDALLGKGAASGPAATAPTPESGDSGSGNETADLVVDLLREVGEPLHYRDIERELRERGVLRVEGKNPANTLLSRFFNDPRLYRPRRGTYALRNGSAARSVGTRRKRSRRGK